MTAESKQAWKDAGITFAIVFFGTTLAIAATSPMRAAVNKIKMAVMKPQTEVPPAGNETPAGK